MQIEGLAVGSPVAASAMQSAQAAATDGQNKKFVDALKTAQTEASKAKSAAADKKLKAACEGFEEMFLDLMYSKMRETVPEDSLFGQSNGEKTMQSMLDSEMTKHMAKAGGIGLGDMIYKQMKKTNQA